MTVSRTPATPRFLRLALLLLVVLFGVMLAAQVRAETAAAAPDAANDRRILVMLKLGADHYRAGTDYGGGYGDTVGAVVRRRTAQRIARDHHLQLVEAWPMAIIGVDCVIMIVPGSRSLETVTAELSTLPEVAWSQPLNMFHVEAAPAPSSATSSATAHARSPNDQLYPAQPASRQWQLNRLHGFATGKGITVAVVDSRIDGTHPDLNGQISRNENFTTEAGHGGERHGTGVAGIIAARANNKVGIVGVAPEVKVMGLRACWEKAGGGGTVCDSLSLAKALTFAIERGATVINMSLSGPDDRLIATLIGIGLARGVDVVAAVDGTRPDNGFPASVPGVIAVSDKHLSLTQANVYSAPGADVPTTEPGGTWDLVSGSSYAAAHVSGLVALIQQANRRNAKPVAMTAALGSHGEIDACAALARALPPVQGRCLAP